MTTDYVYDVALSFAGEDRDYVRQVADLLRANGVRVFYDEYERANLWGKELIEYLEDVYTNKSDYVIMFVSKSYISKDWTNHERISALNRALKSKEKEYILPVRLDDSKLPGLPNSIAFLSAKDLSAMDVSDLFLEKTGRKKIATVQHTLNLYRVTRKKYSEDVSGFGALYGGTWNRQGVRLLYTATSTALSILETYTHLNPSFLINDYAIVQYAVPANLKIETIYESDLPSDWNQLEGSKITQEIGTQWAQKNENLILSVPSAVVPNDRIYLLNPDNIKFSELRINKIDSFEFNRRLRRNI